MLLQQSLRGLLRSMPLVLVGVLTVQVSAQIPTLLTDKVSRGAGVIDLLVDVSSEDLSSYLSSGTLYLGVDLNENAAGNETRDSVGVAIDSLVLTLQTTNGEVSFSDFYTNTTAMIQAAGSSDTSEYYTLFGTLGSSQINGANADFEISAFDDVIEVRDIQVDGEILGASLSVNFLDTEGNGANETFFDYSNGFEDFAIFTNEDATILDSADVGLSAAPTDIISFTQYDNISAAAGAPMPSWLVLAVIPVFLFVAGRYVR